MPIGGLLDTADEAQRAAVSNVLALRHVMANCGPGRGKTHISRMLHEEFASQGVPFLATGSSDRVVGNLVAKGLPGANLQRILAELGRMSNGLAISPVAQANEALVAFLAAVKRRNLVVLAIDECGLVSAQLFDALIAKLVKLNSACFRNRRVVFYMTADLANQLPPISGSPFIFSTTFRLIRDNTWFAYLTNQHRFGSSNVGHDVADLLSAQDDELEQYLGAQKRAYQKLSPARLARLATFVTKRADVEQHIETALRVCFDGEPVPSYSVDPPAGHEGSTTSTMTRATYWMYPGMKTIVEVTTMGGGLDGTTEDGDKVSVPNRTACELLALYDVPEAARADKLAGKAVASILYDGEVVAVPLIHKLEGVYCVTLRMMAMKEDDDIVCEAHLACNEQGYEYPGTLAVGMLELGERRPMSRETILVIATRTPNGPQHVLFHPNTQLKRTDPTKHAAYRKQLASFTPHRSGDGTTMAAEKGRPKPAPAAAAGPPPSSSKRPRVEEHPGSFLGSLY